MDYKVYQRRWVILAGVLACGFMRGYLPSMFAIVNDMMSAYFGISPLLADMLTSADCAVAVVVCLATAVIGNKAGVRLLSLSTASSFVACSVAVGVGIKNRSLYALMLVGRLVSGVYAANLYILPPILANAWFPSNQVATAASLPATALCMGAIVAPMIFSNLLPKVNETDAIYNSSELTSYQSNDFHRLQLIVVGNMAVFLALSMISIGIFCVFAKNNPPSPPSGAQSLLLNNPESKRSLDLKQNYRSLLKILKIRSFWSVTSITMTSASSLAFSIFLQPSLLKATFVSTSNSVVGYCMMLTTACSAFGSIVAGKVLDKSHVYKRSAVLALLLSGGGCVAIYFSHIYEILPIFFVFHAIVGFFRLFLYVCITELMLEVTYPQNRIVATCLLSAFYNLSIFLWTTLERWVMARIGEDYVAMVVAVSQLAAAVIAFFSEPQYKRTKANEMKVQDLENTSTA